MAIVVSGLLSSVAQTDAAAESIATTEIAARLMAGYPGLVTSVAGNVVTFAGGTTLPFDDGKGEKTFQAWLDAPDIEDMFRWRYPAGAPATAAPENFDPGRARNPAFFEKIYGDCRTGGVEKKLVDVDWLPKKSGGRVKVTSINGVADRLKAVSDALDELPKSFDVYLRPIGGTYNCRVVAGTQNVSAHSYGIAIDIAVTRADYWRWAKGGPAARIRYRNRIPLEIVSAFEKHGFIWGGRWHHYDTMHFEYRPELLGQPGP